jgi:hypothetical protein
MKVWMNSLRRKQPYDEAAGRRELNDYLAKWEKDKGLPPSDLEISQGVGADAAGEQQGPPEPGGQVAAGTGAGNTPNDSSVFDNLDPATAQALMGLGDKDRQLAYAEKMRDQDAPSGRYVSNGRIYVGASPIEQGMSAYTRFRGAKDAKRIGEEQTQGRLSVLDLLRGKKQNVDSAPETVADNM